MTPEQFCYWFQGFAELSGDAAPTPEQWKSIREHVATVFKKVTPQVLGPVIPGQVSPKTPAELYRDYVSNKPMWPTAPLNGVEIIC